MEFSEKSNYDEEEKQVKRDTVDDDAAVKPLASSLDPESIPLDGTRHTTFANEAEAANVEETTNGPAPKKYGANISTTTNDIPIPTNVVNKNYTSAPQDLICPEPLPHLIADANSDIFSGSRFHPVLHQSRRDMYGGDLRLGIPNGFQHILYDISNAVIKRNNYGIMDQTTAKVFNGKHDMHEYLAMFLEQRLMQRKDVNGKTTEYNPEDDDDPPKKERTSTTVYMRTLDNSGFTNQQEQ